MKKQNIFATPVKGIQVLQYGASSFLTIILAGLMIFLASCQKEEVNDIKLAGDLTISSSATDIILVQKNDKNTANTFNWTTGTNNGNGASISYVLQIDKAGNNFASPLAIEMGKAIYAKSFTVADLNKSLLDVFGLVPEMSASIETRVVATINSEPSTTQTSPVIAIKVTPYKPVSKTLYILGDATKTGWDAAKATALIADADNSTLFVYTGVLGAGSYKFITVLGQLLPSYNRGADDAHVIYRASDSESDNKFSIAEAGKYQITVNLLDLTINSVKLAQSAYDHIYLVGDAAPNGYDISKATELIQDPAKPYLFTYTGVMKTGEFKFPVNRNTDWQQDMLMKLTDSTMYVHNGGDPDDNKWNIAKKGYYTIKLNLLDNTISMSRTKLYMVGSAAPNGWSIDKATEMTENATDGCIFTYTGPMAAGEFKFPVNRQTDWGQDMYMRTDDTHMYRHVGGASDDNKWNITTAGNYVITANIETLGISISAGKK